MFYSFSFDFLPDKNKYSYYNDEVEVGKLTEEYIGHTV